jgi:Uma2 family endonuclease
MRVEVIPNRQYVFPDVVAYCGKGEFDDQERVLRNPLVIVEVASPSTQRYDKHAKFLLYQRIASLQAYLIIAQKTPGVELYERSEHGHSWIYQHVQGIASQVEIRALNCTLLLSDVYRNVTFEPSSDDVPGA